uniref:NAC3 n=1 Tax=Haloxylon ammodendron TaxID=151230 RepID=A0A1B1SHU0_9CARY|nr:NAC3 [Haloxylon ammodendron]
MVQYLDNYQHMMETNEHDVVDMKQLPPGFRFDPTDEELVLHFLYSKLKVPFYSRNSYDNNNNLNLIIPELGDVFDHYHPCQLHGEAFESCGQWYFYTRKTDYRASETGYWKELPDMDEPIVTRNSNKLVGFKKCLVYYEGKYPSSGVQTGWFMQEYHALSFNFGAEIHHKRRRRRSKQPDVNKWVLCRVQQVCEDSQWMTNIIHDQDNLNNEVELSSSDEAVLLAMDEEDNDDQDEIISYPY